MKKNILLLSILFTSIFMLSGLESQAIKIVFGTRSHPNGNGGCEGERGICIILDIRILKNDVAAASLGDNMGTADINLVSKSRLKLDVLSDNSKDNTGPNFVVEKDVSIGSEICKLMGLKSLVIKAGKYKMDYSKLPNGSVILDVATQ